jgi:alkylation response protein AidB-like acyl-CoA dehydrogenase
MSADLDRYRAAARDWLSTQLPRRPDRQVDPAWGTGSDRIAVHHNFSQEEERAHIDVMRAWVRAKADAGYAAITWEPEFGGAGLTVDHARAFADEERRFQTPPSHEAVGISLELVGNTIRSCGTDDQKRRYLTPLVRCDELWCQLMSEPGAGSDLASLATRAVRDGDTWVINGQKVWTSGAQHADFGYLLARTDPDVPKHKGITAFLIDMRAPGVTVRPLRQMTGGASFNEVFLDDVRVGDDHRLGEIGAGWQVAVTTLMFERTSACGGVGDAAGSYQRVLLLARHLGLTGDPVVRQQLARLHTESRIASLTAARVRAALLRGEVPGPEGSAGKLILTRVLQRTTEVVGQLLGPRLTADTGEWGTYCWAEYVTGAPGFRIGGGTDEIQRNIIGERVLGLPREPR